MHVVEKLAAHFEVQLAADLLAPLVDVLRLHLDVEVAIESGAHSVNSPVASAKKNLTQETLPGLAGKPKGRSASSAFRRFHPGIHTPTGKRTRVGSYA